MLCSCSTCYGVLPVSVCRKPVFCWDSWMDQVGFCHRSHLHLSSTLCCKKIWVSSKIRVLPFRTWPQTLNGADFFLHFRTSTVACVVNLVSLTTDSCQFIRLGVHLCLQHCEHETWFVAWFLAQFVYNSWGLSLIISMQGQAGDTSESEAVTRWQHCYTPFTWYNRLSNRIDIRLYRVKKHPTRLTTRLTTMLNEQPLFVQPVVKPGCTTSLITGCIHDTTGCQTGLRTGWMFVYMIHWQPVVSCIQTFTRLSNLFDNRFDNGLHRVNGALLCNAAVYKDSIG